MDPRQRVTYRVRKPAICRPELDAELFGENEVVSIIDSGSTKSTSELHRPMMVALLIHMCNRQG